MTWRNPGALPRTSSSSPDTYKDAGADPTSHERHENSWLVLFCSIVVPPALLLQKCPHIFLNFSETSCTTFTRVQLNPVSVWMAVGKSMVRTRAATKGVGRKRSCQPPARPPHVSPCHRNCSYILFAAHFLSCDSIKWSTASTIAPHSIPVSNTERKSSVTKFKNPMTPSTALNS